MTLRNFEPMISRRNFIQSSSLIALGFLAGCKSSAEQPEADTLEAFIESMLAEDRAPGFSAAIVRGEKLVWSKGFGKADIERDIPRTADSIQNIGSISKTVTATAVMQLWEEGAFKLDDDVNTYLSFLVRNPRFPDQPITFRQLLTHRSSITDGPSYGASYACGDPAVSLADWIAGYFSPDGAYYDAEANFHTWKPGTIDPPTPPRAYTNVGFGLLGLLVEKLSGEPFNAFCRRRIFEPLGMERTGWHLEEIDRANHVVPYSLLDDDHSFSEGRSFSASLPQEGLTEDMAKPGTHFPHCLYSFYNYPDGLVRTSVNDLSRFLRAYGNGGTFEGHQILKTETVDLMLSHEHFEQGLGWHLDTMGDNGDFWGHSGGDPGVETYMGFRKQDKLGIIMFYNYGEASRPAGRIRSRLIEEGA